MSTIRALGTNDTAATVYAASQAGYDAAVAALTAAGGVIEIGYGLDSINLGTLPADIVVLRFLGAPNGMEIGGGVMVVGNTFSYRMRDSAGTARSVLTALGTDVLRLSWLASGGLTITDQNGNIKCTLTGTRVNWASGVDLAFNSLPGSANQFLTSQGPATSPQWTLPPGLPGSTMVALLGASMWGNGLSTVVPGVAYVYSSMGDSDNSNYMVWTVPLAYTSTTSWKLYWSGPLTGGNAVWEFSMCRVSSTSFDFNAGSWTSGAKQTVAVPSAHVLSVVTMPTPAVSVSAGDQVLLKIRRIGNDAGDTSTAAVNFIGMLHTYT